MPYNNTCIQPLKVPWRGETCMPFVALRTDITRIFQRAWNRLLSLQLLSSMSQWKEEVFPRHRGPTYLHSNNVETCLNYEAIRLHHLQPNYSLWALMATIVLAHSSWRSSFATFLHVENLYILLGLLATTKGLCGNGDIMGRGLLDEVNDLVGVGEWREWKKDDSSHLCWHECGMLYLDYSCEFICELKTSLWSMAMGQVLLPRIGGDPY